MRINTNVGALTAWRNLGRNDAALSKSLERLSTGMRINRGQDDASGLAISERLRSQISSLTQAERNLQDGVNLVAIADATLDSMTSIVQRIRDLKTIDMQGTVSGTTQTALNTELEALKTQLLDLAQSAAYAGSSLFTSAGTTFTIQAGPNAGNAVTVAFSPLTGQTFGTNDLGALTATLGQASLTVIDNVINWLATERAKTGANANALDSRVDTVLQTRETLLSADSRIRDTDVAYETTLLTRSQILVQSATAMLAQANARPANMLALLQ